MDLRLIWSQLTIVAIITACQIDDSDCECPTAYWDEPSKTCAQPLVLALESQQTANNEGESAELTRVNTTCTAWHQTDTCYQQLLRKCHSNERARQEIQMHIGRYRVYSHTCSGHSKYRHRLVDCFLPHIKPTRTCSEAFDRYFRNFVNDKQFRNACRVVSTAMKCFHEIKTDVAVTCKEEAAEEYQRNYIQPLVDQTKDTVTSKCTMSPPYDHYFNYAPPSERNAYYVMPALGALLFPRWRHTVTFA